VRDHSIKQSNNPAISITAQIKYQLTAIREQLSAIIFIIFPL